MTLFWPILDPLPHVTFGDTGEAPLASCTFFIFQNTSFFSGMKKAQNEKLLFKKDQKMSRDTLADPLSPPCVIWSHSRDLMANKVNHKLTKWIFFC